MGNRYPVLLVFLAILYQAIAVAVGYAGEFTHDPQWKAVPGEYGPERMLYDPDSVVPSGPRAFRVWILTLDADHSPRRSLEEVDCSNRIVRDIEVVLEKPGKSASHKTIPSEWRDVPKESPRGGLLKILCR